MKKLLLASAIAALSVTAANAAPTVYGKAFLTLDYVNTDADVDTTTYDADGKKLDRISTNEDDDGRSKLNSTSSRIGVKGSEALTADTDLVYQLEYGISPDNDTKSEQFKSRDTYLGLSNKQYGLLVAGRLTAIDDYIDYATVAQGKVLGGDNVLSSFDGERANNTFAYFSPDYNGWQVMAMYVLDENNEGNKKDKDSFGRDAYGIGAKYEAGPANFGITYIGAGDDLDAVRVSGNYAINDTITIGALYEFVDRNKDDDENTFALSGEMKTASPWTAYIQGDYVTNYENVDDDRYRVVVGGKYKFNKATTGHIYGAYMNTDSDIMSKSDKDLDYYDTRTETDKDEFGIGAGIEYKF